MNKKPAIVEVERLISEYNYIEYKNFDKSMVDEIWNIIQDNQIEYNAIIDTIYELLKKSNKSTTHMSLVEHLIFYKIDITPNLLHLKHINSHEEFLSYLQEIKINLQQYLSYKNHLASIHIDINTTPHINYHDKKLIHQIITTYNQLKIRYDQYQEQHIHLYQEHIFFINKSIYLNQHDHEPNESLESLELKRNKLEKEIENFKKIKEKQLIIQMNQYNKQLTLLKIEKNVENILLDVQHQLQLKSHEKKVVNISYYVMN